MSNGADCIFCAIVAGSIPAAVVAETPGTLAFSDIDPKADVHVVVIPKRHFANFAEVAAFDAALAAELIATVAAAADRAGVGDGYRMLTNTGAGGGQSVFHAHLHLLAGKGLPAF